MMALIMLKFVLLLSLLFETVDSFRASFRKSSFSLKVQSWQNDVDTLLKIDTTWSSRRNLTQGLFSKVKDIRSDVVSAIQDRNISKIAPATLEYGKNLAGLQTFQRQIIEDILPNLPRVVPSVMMASPKAVSAIIKSAPELRKDFVSTARNFSANDPAYNISLLQNAVGKEVRNIFRRTPEGLETPDYRVVSQTNAYEVRSYNAYSVISSQPTNSTTTSSVVDIFEPINFGTAFATLASYLFGKNIQKEKLEMTTPVIVEGGRVEFVLPNGLTSQSAPTPSGDLITIRDVPSQVLAVREFAGFATEGEVSRQRALLENSLQLDNILYDNLSFKVFQYNPPQTLPWLRRNEVSVVVMYKMIKYQ